METQKIVVILLIVAIAFSVLSIMMTMGLDIEGFEAAGTDEGNQEDSGSGQVSLEILPPPEGGA